MYKSTKRQADNIVPCQEIHGVPLEWKRKNKVQSVHSVQYSEGKSLHIYIYIKYTKILLNCLIYFLIQRMSTLDTNIILYYFNKISLEYKSFFTIIQLNHNWNSLSISRYFL